MLRDASREVEVKKVENGWLTGKPVMKVPSFAVVFSFPAGTFSLPRNASPSSLLFPFHRDSQRKSVLIFVWNHV
jgi:hypothetical protein